MSQKAVINWENNQPDLENGSVRSLVDSSTDMTSSVWLMHLKKEDTCLPISLHTQTFNIKLPQET